MKNFCSAKTFLVVFAAAAPVLALGQSAPNAEIDSLRQEIKELKAGQAGMRSDLAEIKKLIAGIRTGGGAPQFKPTEISLDGAPVLGDSDAKVTLVEFTDLQCPFCSRHYKNTKPQIVENFVDSGKVRYIVREFPLTNIHPRAAKASEASLCAGDQGKYWEMHGLIFENQRALTDADFMGHAEAIALEKGSFEACMTSSKYAEQVKADLAMGKKAGITATPSFVLGVSDPNNAEKFTATEFIRGARSYADFESVLNKLVEQAESKAAARSDD